MKEYQSLSHTRLDCKHHIVFIPKRRKKKVFGILRRPLVEIFHELAVHKESKIVEGHMMGDHVHMCLSIPQKYAVSNVVGYLKGKSAIQIARRFGGRQKTFHGRAFLGSWIFCLDSWVGGEYCSSIHPQPGRGRRAVRSDEARHGVAALGGSWVYGRL
jgi:putative transposase